MPESLLIIDVPRSQCPESLIIIDVLSFLGFSIQGFSMEGSEELIPRCGESGWSEDDGIPNPDVRMIKKLKTKSCNTKNIVMVAGAAGALLVSAFFI